jgi:hypothetical protein
MAKKITRVLLATGALKSDPTDGDYTRVFFDKPLTQLSEKAFHPGINDEQIRGNASLPSLTDAQWDTLIPVGTLSVPPLVFGRGTAKLTEQSQLTLDELIEQLQALAAAPADERETVLLIIPQMLQDFLAFNDFLDEADAVLQELDMEGVFQVASFHPQFQFADTEPDDVGNFTNRSPYPTLHLIREESIDRAVEAFPEAEMIYETNIATMEKLGAAGWKALDVGPHD